MVRMGGFLGGFLGGRRRGGGGGVGGRALLCSGVGGTLPGAADEVVEGGRRWFHGRWTVSILGRAAAFGAFLLGFEEEGVRAKNTSGSRLYGGPKRPTEDEPRP